VAIKHQTIIQAFNDDTIYKYAWRILRCEFFIKFSGILDDKTERICLALALARSHIIKRHDDAKLQQLIAIILKTKKTKDYSDIKSMWSDVFKERRSCPTCGRHGQLKWRARTEDYRCDFCGMVFDV
jgi:predicted RNA-binding Zn-ribbon protein involved in translation (DUF1610 family)